MYGCLVRFKFFLLLWMGKTRSRARGWFCEKRFSFAKALLISTFHSSIFYEETSEAIREVGNAPEHGRGWVCCVLLLLFSKTLFYWWIILPFETFTTFIIHDVDYSLSPRANFDHIVPTKEEKKRKCKSQQWIFFKKLMKCKRSFDIVLVSLLCIKYLRSVKNEFHFKFE